jgi:hypothetical protein
MGMLAMRLLLSPGDELGGEAEEQGFTVETGVEGARGMVDDPEKMRDTKSFKQVPVITWRFGPWALNQDWKELAGQAKESGALNVLNFKKGYNPNNFGALICGTEKKP